MASVDLSAWQADHFVRFLFLAAAAAPLILAYIVVRDHQLSWPRGEVTALVSVTTIVLVLVLGFVARPGEPRDTISLEVGWFVALVASVGMLIGATQRSSKSAPPSKPPGVM
jgi:4-amino-4-deoxy-L-arabinose transferase-like glycosyltransferase